MELLTGLVFFGLAAAIVLAYRRDWRIKVWEWIDGVVRGSLSWPWLVAIGGGLSTFAVLTLPRPDGALIVLVSMALALFAAVWFRHFGFLMAQADDAFPGRHDKLVWVALMVALPPLGLIAFDAFRKAQFPAAEKPRTVASDLR